MAKLDGDNVGAQSKDGIQVKVGMTYLPTNRTVLLMPLQKDCPTDPEEMIVQGEPTYTLDKMFDHLKPKVEVALKTGEETNPLQDHAIEFKALIDFEPDKIVENVPLLRNLRDQQMLINRLEQLLQEGAFQKILKDKTQKAALVGFLRSVIADIESVEKED